MYKSMKGVFLRSCLRGARTTRRDYAASGKPRSGRDSAVLLPIDASSLGVRSACSVCQCYTLSPLWRKTRIINKTDD